MTNGEAKNQLLQEVNQINIALENMRRTLRTATPLADSLAVMKSLDKAKRGIEKIRLEIGGLRV